MRSMGNLFCLLCCHRVKLHQSWPGFSAWCVSSRDRPTVSFTELHVLVWWKGVPAIWAVSQPSGSFFLCPLVCDSLSSQCQECGSDPHFSWHLRQAVFNVGALCQQSARGMIWIYCFCVLIFWWVIMHLSLLQLKFALLTYVLEPILTRPFRSYYYILVPLQVPCQCMRICFIACSVTHGTSPSIDQDPWIKSKRDSVILFPFSPQVFCVGS